jgi:hypothetical protein
MPAGYFLLPGGEQLERRPYGREALPLPCPLLALLLMTAKGIREKQQSKSSEDGSAVTVRRWQFSGDRVAISRHG